MLKLYSIKTSIVIFSLLLALVAQFAISQVAWAVEGSVNDTLKQNQSSATPTTGNPPAGEQLPLKESASVMDVLWTITKLVFALGLIIVLIYLLVRFLSRRSGNYYTQRKLRIIAGIGLSPQKTLQIVEVGGKVYLLGVGQDVRLLDKIEDPQEIANLLESLDHSLLESEFITSWKDRFRNAFKKKQIVSEDLDYDEYEKMVSGQALEENRERSNES